MDATSRRILGLVSEMNVRFVVPVYQRPYSWDAEQCERLLDDIVSCGRRRDVTHFTGSIVTIQDGSLSPQGVAPLLLIDGQQRITTISLLLVALARFDRQNPGVARSFSLSEIAQGGYLTNHYRSGEDHYKLTLSKDDRETLHSLVRNLVDESEPINPQSRRLIDNLALFERLLVELPDIDEVWAGLQRLEVVSISLAQGQDQPQVIFESMNSTGKDLSSADLVRNFVLMSYDIDEQEDVYRVYWSPIERTLGSNAYDGVFDDFIRCYLTVAAPLLRQADGDTYQAFKRYVILGEYRREDRMRILILRLKRFARYYASVTTGQVDDPELAKRLGLIERLADPRVNPLLLSLFDRHERKSFSRKQFIGSLELLEAYLYRRLVCGCDADATPALFASVIARMDAAEVEGNDLADVLKIALLNEAGGARRFPSDDEFALALRSLVEREHVVAADEGDDSLEDAGFDPLALALSDERVNADDLVPSALSAWPRPEVGEQVLRAYRSFEQEQMMAEESER